MRLLDIRLPINNNHNILSGNSLWFREISFFFHEKMHKVCIEKKLHIFKLNIGLDLSDD